MKSVTPVFLVNNRRAGAINRGFTLVELLVVIAIIAILASLLLPVLTKAKDQSTRIVDVNNLKQMALSLNMYANDNQDSLPWSNWAGGDRDRKGWLYTFNASASGPLRFESRTGALWPMLLNSNVYFCPRDKISPNFKRRDQQCSTYVMNGAVNGYDLAVYPAVKLNRMPPLGVALWETDENNLNNYNDGASYPSEGLTTRHARGGVYAEFSGAVAFMKRDNWDRYANEANANQLWCYPDSYDGR
jgi:prepilin-type N-terminal cleavage/methylation domain-containing protein